MQRSSTQTQLFKKSHIEKVTGIILAVTGGAMCLTGVVLAVSSLHGLFDPNVRHNEYGSVSDILGYGEALLMLASMPFALEAKQNKKKAMLYVKKENVITMPGIKVTQLISMGVRIRL